MLNNKPKARQQVKDRLKQKQQLQHVGHTVNNHHSKTATHHKIFVLSVMLINYKIVFQIHSSEKCTKKQ